MTKFNVGDKVRILNGEKLAGNGNYSVTTGKEYEVISFHEKSELEVEHIKVAGNFSNSFTICNWEYKYIELVEMKPTKNQRITALENELVETKKEVAELKLIVHELRGKKSIEPSTTNTVEDIIEFEGNQYRKVDREARKGDVVIFRNQTNNHIPKNNTPYLMDSDDECIEIDVDECCVYSEIHNRTLETVDVYELIKSKPLTPNQQRAAIIEKAKKFVEENLKLLMSYDFVVNNNGLKLYSRQRYQDIQLTTAKCSPNDVFNEHIGKAIALGRELGLDVREFEQAVQPTVAIGQIISNKYWNYEVLTLKNNGKNLKLTDVSTFADGGDLPNRDWYTIINDTNAIY